MPLVRLGCRSSALAKAQAALVKAACGALGYTFQETDITTTGDRVTDRPLYELGGKNLFCKEIDAALRQGVIDWAVHSLKDVESDLAPDLALAAVLPAEDSRDVLVVRDPAWRTLADVPWGVSVGTSSLRRAGHLRAIRGDLVIRSLRGNVPTRLRALDNGFDALVLARAGLNRLGIQQAWIPFDCGVMTPAVAQGVIGVVVRRDDISLWSEAWRILDHPLTRRRVVLERALLSALGATCKTPIGVYGENVGTSDPILHVSLVHPQSGARWYRRYPAPEGVDITAIAKDIVLYAPEALMTWALKNLDIPSESSHIK
jgi:hydroxymethylbilane synthase